MSLNKLYIITVHFVLLVVKTKKLKLKINFYIFLSLKITVRFQEYYVIGLYNVIDKGTRSKKKLNLLFNYLLK